MKKNVVWRDGYDVLSKADFENEEKNCIPPDFELSEMAFKHNAPFTETLWHNHYNKNENNVCEYTLPQFKSETVAEWENSERPEILQQYKDILFGKMPPPPDRMELELLSLKNDALDGLAVRKEIRIHCLMNDGGKFNYDMLLYVPKNAENPPPVFVGLNFYGNQFNTPEMDVRNTRGRRLNPQREFVLQTGRGEKLDAWNFKEAMKRGYAVATACYGEIAPDCMTGIKVSPFALFYDENDLRMDFEVSFAEAKGGNWRRPVSIIGAWAWGLCRMLDALEIEPLVDAERAAVLGHSRLGKTALWAGACDERFKIVISNNSGCGGAALYRRNFGESIFHSFFEQRGWYCGGLAPYVLDVDKLPFDQHMLLALIAPRTLCVASATEDLNADPDGEYLATCEASKIWKLYGLNDVVQQKPAPDSWNGTNVCYSLRVGKHAITAKDWECYYALADRVFGSK